MTMPDHQPLAGGDDLPFELENLAGGMNWTGNVSIADQIARHKLVCQAAQEIARLRSEVERLTKTAGLYQHMREVATANGFESITEAIARAEAAEHALSELKAEALEVVGPFGAAAEHVPPDQDDFKLVAHVPAGSHARTFEKLRNTMTAGDFRRAAAFLNRHGGTR